MEQERRRALRFPFDASAEFVAENSEAKVTARVSEISLSGCYLQTAQPLPRNTTIFVKIFAEATFFEAQATVAYEQPNKGMGLEFREVRPYFLTVLRRWLLEAMTTKQRPGE
jgi:PilZ domain